MNGLSEEFEAELVGYLAKNLMVPPISLDCVMKTAGLIEAKTLKKMKLREKEYGAKT